MEVNGTLEITELGGKYTKRGYGWKNSRCSPEKIRETSWSKSIKTIRWTSTKTTSDAKKGSNSASSSDYGAETQKLCIRVTNRTVDSKMDPNYWTKNDIWERAVTLLKQITRGTRIIRVIITTQIA